MSAKEQATEMKHLGNLSPAKGSNRPKKRLGRGIGSGTGKTAGKGHKGMWARKGSGPAIGFEGGQMPLYMRLPKVGFTNIFRKQFNVVNIDQLGGFSDGETVNVETLAKKGLIRKKSWPLKVLGRGSIEKKLTIEAVKVSASAKEAIEKAGGTLKMIEVKAAWKREDKKKKS